MRQKITNKLASPRRGKILLLLLVVATFVALIFIDRNHKCCFPAAVFAKPIHTNTTTMDDVPIEDGMMNNQQKQQEENFEEDDNELDEGNDGTDEVGKESDGQDDVVVAFTSYGSAENNEDQMHQQQQSRNTKLNPISTRDTFLSLNPEPTRQRTAKNGLQQQSRRKQRKNIAASHEHEIERPLRNGQSLLALTTAGILNSTLLLLQANNCRGDLFKHKVRVPGCLPKTIVNRFCHGSCSSFYVPRLRSKKLKATFQSCSACVPVETDLIKVRLDCPNRVEQNGELYRTIVRVKRCACRDIPIVFEGKENDVESGQGKDTTSSDDVTYDGIALLNND